MFKAWISKDFCGKLLICLLSNGTLTCILPKSHRKTEARKTQVFNDNINYIFISFKCFGFRFLALHMLLYLDTSIIKNVVN